MMISYLDQVNAEEDGNTIVAITDTRLNILDQQRHCLSEDVVEQFLRTVGVQHEELGDEEELSAGIVHQSIEQRSEQHLIWILLLSLLTSVRYNDRSL